MNAKRPSFTPPPPGWLTFGEHADEDSLCMEKGPLTFSVERGEDGFPLWERHDGCALGCGDCTPEGTRSCRAGCVEKGSSHD